MNEQEDIRKPIRCGCGRIIAESRSDNQFLRIGAVNVWANSRTVAMTCANCERALSWFPSDPPDLQTEEQAEASKQIRNSLATGRPPEEKEEIRNVKKDMSQSD